MADINKQSTDVQTQSPSTDERFYQNQSNQTRPMFNPLIPHQGEV